MDDDDPFPRAITITGRLYPEEEPGTVAEEDPVLGEELLEQPRAVDLPPLHGYEEETLPSVRLEAEPDEALDDPAISDGMKSADDIVDRKFLSDHQTTLLRPWDDVDLAGEPGKRPRKRPAVIKK
jgi:hypothetical protein